jgi:hypothetical protein
MTAMPFLHTSAAKRHMLDILTAEATDNKNNLQVVVAVVVC